MQSIPVLVPATAATLGLLVLFTGQKLAAAPLVLGISPDTQIALGAANLAVADHQIVLDNLSGIVLPANVGPLPESSDLIGVARTLGGASLLAVDATVELTGGLVVRPGDVVAWDGVRHTRLFDATAAGLPHGVRTDSVSLAPGGLLLSFDTDVALVGGLTVADEDLVRWDGAMFQPAFDGSAHGLDTALDIDAAQDQGGGTFLLSFDTNGVAGNIPFGDEDVLHFDGTTFTQAFDGSAADPDWVAADLDAFTVPEPERVAAVGTAGLALLGLVRRRRRVARAPCHATISATLALAATGSIFPIASAYASDGVLEINQTCATLTGCFTGDTAGFPVTIDGTAGSSYLLTSDLEVPSANTHGIVVSANRIRIDLNGFALVGPTTCAGTPLTCAPIGLGIGISALPAVGVTARETTVTNGRVAGFGSYGLSLRDGALVEHVTAGENGATGIYIDDGGVVRDCVAGRNGGDGIRALTSSNISGSTTIANQGRGIATGQASTILGNTAYLNESSGIVGGDGLVGAMGVVIADNASRSNQSDGIVVGSGGIARSNTVSLNGDDGIDGGDGSVIRDNAVYQNGDAASDDGIECDAGCSVQANVVRENDGFGLNLGVGSAYHGNTVTLNGAGTANGGVARSDNYCDGAAAPACP